MSKLGKTLVLGLILLSVLAPLIVPSVHAAPTVSETIKAQASAKASTPWASGSCSQGGTCAGSSGSSGGDSSAFWSLSGTEINNDYATSYAPTQGAFPSAFQVVIDVFGGAGLWPLYQNYALFWDSVFALIIFIGLSMKVLGHNDRFPKSVTVTFGIIFAIGFSAFEAMSNWRLVNLAPLAFLLFIFIAWYFIYGVVSGHSENKAFGMAAAWLLVFWILMPPFLKAYLAQKVPAGWEILSLITAIAVLTVIFGLISRFKGSGSGTSPGGSTPSIWGGSSPSLSPTGENPSVERARLKAADAEEKRKKAEESTTAAAQQVVSEIDSLLTQHAQAGNDLQENLRALRSLTQASEEYAQGIRNTLDQAKKQGFNAAQYAQGLGDARAKLRQHFDKKREILRRIGQDLHVSRELQNDIDRLHEEYKQLLEQADSAGTKAGDLEKYLAQNTGAISRIWTKNAERAKHNVLYSALGSIIVGAKRTLEISSGFYKKQQEYEDFDKQIIEQYADAKDARTSARWATLVAKAKLKFPLVETLAGKSSSETEEGKAAATIRAAVLDIISKTLNARNSVKAAFFQGKAEGDALAVAFERARQGFNEANALSETLERTYTQSSAALDAYGAALALYTMNGNGGGYDRAHNAGEAFKKTLIAIEEGWKATNTASATLTTVSRELKEALGKHPIVSSAFARVRAYTESPFSVVVERAMRASIAYELIFMINADPTTKQAQAARESLANLVMAIETAKPSFDHKLAQEAGPDFVQLYKELEDVHNLSGQVIPQAKSVLAAPHTPTP